MLPDEDRTTSRPFQATLGFVDFDVADNIEEDSDLPLCACGCGGRVKYVGVRFRYGHHMKMPEYHAHQRKESITNVCEWCQESFVAKKHHRHRQRFCSKRCAVRFKNKDAEKVERQCEWCRKAFVRLRSRLNESRNKGRFCSMGCRSAFSRDKRLKNLSPSNYRGNAYLLKGIRRCERCSYAKIPEILVVHHKDGDRGNGHIDNLEILCPTCHSEDHFLNDGTVLVPAANHATTVEKRKMDRFRTGRVHSNSRLNIDQVKEMVVLHEQGVKPAELSAKFGVSKGAVSCIMNGKTWGWLTGIKNEGDRHERFANREMPISPE